MTLREAQQQLKNTLSALYDEREAATIADWVMEKITGLKKIDRILLSNRLLSPEDQSLLEKYTEELQTHRPVQYVLGESWFCGLQFRVDERVLIPRPETEELVEWILQTAASQQASKSSQPSANGFQLLDIGTGSGCIPISLKKKLPEATVLACDISEAALSLARQNAADNDTPVNFFHFDILQSLSGPVASRGNDRFAVIPVLPLFDLIVSNPPYIPLKDRLTMRANVLAFEPSLALFVENEDPLLFYRAIAAFAGHHLAPGGNIFVELHEDLAAETGQVFRRHGFDNIILKKDLQGKDRMIKASVNAENQ